MRVLVAIAVCAPLAAAFLPGLRPPPPADEAPRPSPPRAPIPPRAPAVPSPAASVTFIPAGGVPTTYIATSYYAPPVCSTAPSAPTPTAPTSPSGERRCPTSAPVPWAEWWRANRWRLAPVPIRGAPCLEELAVLRARLREIAAEDRDSGPVSAALIALAKTSGRSSEDFAATHLGRLDSPPSVREAAALALGLTGAEPAAVAALVADRSRPLDERVHALLGLGLGGARLAGPIIEGEIDESCEPAVRTAAILAAGLLGGDRWIERCRAVLRDGGAPQAVRAAAAVTLARVGCDGAAAAATTRVLTQLALSDRDPLVRGAAVLGLARARSEAVLQVASSMAAFDRDPQVCGLALVSAAEQARAVGSEDALRTVRERAVRALGRDSPVRGFAALALGLVARGDAAAGAALRAAFQTDPDADAAAACAIGLGLAGDGRAVPILAGQVRQPACVFDVEAGACVGLGMLAPQHPDAAAELVAAVERSIDTSRKSAAAMSLVWAGSGRTRAAIYREGLSSRNRYFTCSVLLAIAERRSAAHLEDVAACYRRERNAETREWAVVAMGCIADPSRVPTLRRIACGFTPEVLGDYLPSIARVLALP